MKPLDRHRRDPTLFQFTTRRLRDFVDPDHLLIRIDEQFDFARLVAPLEDRYCLDNGRPAIHSEVMIRALLICSLYNISSFRRLSSAIAENIAYRWFCFLTIDDPVFDHSSISYFIERIGREGFTTSSRALMKSCCGWVCCYLRCTLIPAWSRPTSTATGCPAAG